MNDGLANIVIILNSRIHEYDQDYAKTINMIIVHFKYSCQSVDRYGKAE
jgi:hypothetical protein